MNSVIVVAGLLTGGITTLKIMRSAKAHGFASTDAEDCKLALAFLSVVKEKAPIYFAKMQAKLRAKGSDYEKMQIASDYVGYCLREIRNVHVSWDDEVDAGEDISNFARNGNAERAAMAYLVDNITKM